MVWLYFYFISKLFRRGCSFKSLLYIFQKFNIIINVQSNNWTIKFTIIYLKCCFSCLYCFHFMNRWVCIWMSRYSRCYRYFRNYATFCPWQIKFYFKINLYKWGISNNYSNFLMKQQLLWFYYQHLVFLFSFLFS